ncbi:hypothetical protein Peur_019623 [Populus x canadensis]
MRRVPVGLLFLIPGSDPNLPILPAEMLKTKKVMILLNLNSPRWLSTECPVECLLSEVTPPRHCFQSLTV